MFISAAMARAVVVEVERRGHGTEALLRAAGLERDPTADSTEGLRWSVFERVIRAATALTQDQALGLAVGQHTSTTALHALGLALMSSLTVRDAFAHLCRYGALVAEGIAWSLEEDEDSAVFGYACSRAEEASEGDDSARFAAELAITLTARIARELVAEARPEQILLQCARPSYAARYEEVFGCPIHFLQTRNALVMPRGVLDRTQPHADARVSSMMCELAESRLQEATRAGSLTERVRRALRYQRSLASIDFDKLAARWELNRGMLYRRLANEGSSVAKLVDDARCMRALDELRDPQREVKCIAEELGYSEISAFHRAFKRWTGTTASAYRKTLSLPGVPRRGQASYCNDEPAAALD